MSERYSMETMDDTMIPFIIDNNSSKKNGRITSYHTYETHKKDKCLELVNLLNDYEKTIEKRNAHQRVLEDKIHRMREAIHKLDWLATHRNSDLIRENSNLKNRISIYEALLDANDLLGAIDWMDFCILVKCKQPEGTDCETCDYLGAFSYD